MTSENDTAPKPPSSAGRREEPARDAKKERTSGSAPARKVTTHPPAEEDREFDADLSPLRFDSATPAPQSAGDAPQPPKEEEEGSDADAMWKLLMEDNFDDMLESVLPELAAQVDRSRSPVFLNNEMKDIKALVGGTSQQSDLLVKVPIKGGRDIWLAFHVEVQGAGGDDFSERMFFYHAIIRFKHLKRKKYEEDLAAKAAIEAGKRKRMPKKRRGIVDVVSAAILTAPRPKGETEHYEHASYGNELRYVYPAIKLWELDPAELEASPNPFDLALLAVRRAVDGGCDDMRIASLKQLGGLLEERGLTRERSVSLYRFIEWMLRPESKEKYDEYRKWMEGERKVYITVAEEIGMEKGIEVGKEKGIEIGKEIGKGEGILIGKEETRRETALKMLRRGFDIPDIAEILDIPEDEVARLAEEDR